MKFALLGYGFMGGAHLAALLRIEGVEVKAVASRTRPAANGSTRGNMDLASGPLPESVRWTPDWREIIADPEIDAVDICLPTDMHREVVLAALAAGKHVLCEKPMGLNMADCAEILGAARRSDRILMIGQVVRFMGAFRYAANFVKERAGQIVSCTLRRSTGYPSWGGWLIDEKRSGGAILDLLSHDVDQALHWFGEPMLISASSAGPRDTMRGVLRYKGGLEVVVEGGWLEPEAKFTAEFEVEAAKERLVFTDNKLVLHRAGGSEVIAIPEHDPYFDEVNYFVSCCRDRSAPAECMPEDSARTVALSLELKASRDAGGKEIVWQA
jgi:predicted dehydrogenase